jgi:hypothetical protein
MIGFGIICALSTMGVLVHDLYPRAGGWVTTIVMLMSFLVLLAFAVWTERIWDRQEEQSAEIPKPFYVTQGPAFVTPATNRLGQMTAFAVTYPYLNARSSLHISAINLALFVTVENMQAVPSMIEAYSLENAQSVDGPWTALCPVILSGGQLMYLADLSHVYSFDINNALELELIGQQISEHSTVAGWTFWECPPSLTVCYKRFLRFTIRDAAGKIGETVLTPIKPRPHELSTQASFLKRKAGPLDFNNLTLIPWNQCH